MDLNEILKNERKNKGLSLRELSKISGVNASYISRLERGIDTKPGLEVLLKLSNALKISVIDLITPSIGLNIKKIRESKNMSQKELAKKSELPEEIIIAYENDDGKPDIENLKKIAAALDTTFNHFFDGIKPNELFEVLSPYEVLGEDTSKKLKQKYEMLRKERGLSSNINKESKDKIINKGEISELSIINKMMEENSREDLPTIFAKKQIAQFFNDKNFDKIKGTIENLNINLYLYINSIANKDNIKIDDSQINEIISKVYDSIDFEVFKIGKSQSEDPNK